MRWHFEETKGAGTGRAGAGQVQVTFGQMGDGEVAVQPLLELVRGGLRGGVEALRRQAGARAARRLRRPLGPALHVRASAALRPTVVARCRAFVPLAVLRYRELQPRLTKQLRSFFAGCEAYFDLTCVIKNCGCNLGNY